MMLSRFKSGSQPRLEDVLHEALVAWEKTGRDVLRQWYAKVEWRDTSGDWQTRLVGSAIG